MFNHVEARRKQRTSVRLNMIFASNGLEIESLKREKAEMSNEGRDLRIETKGSEVKNRSRENMDP